MLNIFFGLKVYLEDNSVHHKHGKMYLTQFTPLSTGYNYYGLIPFP
jgi:hypothetical protein